MFGSVSHKTNPFGVEQYKFRLTNCRTQQWSVSKVVISQLVTKWYRCTAWRYRQQLRSHWCTDQRHRTWEDPLSGKSSLRTFTRSISFWSRLLSLCRWTYSTRCEMAPLSWEYMWLHTTWQGNHWTWSLANWSLGMNNTVLSFGEPRNAPDQAKKTKSSS